MRVHLDMETRSTVDLAVAGAYRYAIDESTSVLCIGYCFDDGEIKLWTRRSAPPTDLITAALDPSVRFHAFNVGFERRLWEFVLHRRLGWPAMPIERWQDTQADALAMGFPAALKACAEALGLDAKKDASGTRLINLLAKPKDRHGNFREKTEVPQAYFELYDYCRQDVRVERAIYHALGYHTTKAGQERRVWAMTERLNDNGVPIDEVGVTALKTLLDDKIYLTEEQLRQRTDGRVTSSGQTAKLNAELDFPLPDFRAATLDAALEEPLLSDWDRFIIHVRKIGSNASTKKLKRMLESVCPDGWVRDLLQYHGAATGRYAGRGIQIQNFPRKAAKNADTIMSLAIDPSVTLDEFEEEFGEIQNVVKSMLRPCICAPDGHVIICRDYSQIEARATAWAVKDEAQLEVFRADRDIYVATAAEMYGLRYEEIGKEGPERQAGKVAVLACGYQGGWSALLDFALGYGIKFTPKQSYGIVSRFREARPRLVQAWKAFGDAALAAVAEPGNKETVPGCQFVEFQMKGPHLTMRLPNGKLLWFPFAQIKTEVKKYKTPEGEVRAFQATNVTHMWMDQGRWCRRGLHGGSFFQSYVQAICRELICEAMLRLEDRGWPINMQVHDEVASVVRKRSTLDDEVAYEQTITEVPEWATGLPVAADGWRGTRYRK